jgi:hypothetical protein
MYERLSRPASRSRVVTHKGQNIFGDHPNDSPPPPHGGIFRPLVFFDRSLIMYYISYGLSLETFSGINYFSFEIDSSDKFYKF